MHSVMRDKRPQHPRRKPHRAPVQRLRHYLARRALIKGEKLRRGQVQSKTDFLHVGFTVPDFCFYNGFHTQ